jgi:hypothetical protein
MIQERCAAISPSLGGCEFLRQRREHAALLSLKCCSNRRRIRPAALVPYLRSASSLIFNVAAM